MATIGKEDADKIAEAFTTARRTATPLAAFPGPLPPTFSDAYAVQDAAIARWPDRIAGWKIAAVAPAFRDRFTTPRLAGPAFSANIVKAADGGAPARIRVFAGGFAAIEAEFIFRVGAPIDANDASQPDRLLEKIAALHAGAEVASSPFAGINELGPTSVISDFGNNAGLLLGPEIPNWRSRAPDDMTSRASVNGADVGEGHAGKVAGGPLSALSFLVSALAERGRALGPGDLVSTGMTTGIHPIAPGDEIRLTFDDSTVLSAVVERAQPQG